MQPLSSSFFAPPSALPSFAALTVLKDPDLSPKVEEAFEKDILPYYKNWSKTKKAKALGIDFIWEIANNGFTRTRKQPDKDDVVCTRTFNDTYHAQNMRDHTHPANLLTNQDFCWFAMLDSTTQGK